MSDLLERPNVSDEREMVSVPDRIERHNRLAGALAGVASLALAGVVTLTAQSLLPSSEKEPPNFGKESTTSQTKTTRETKIRQPKTKYLEVEPLLQPEAVNP